MRSYHRISWTERLQIEKLYNSGASERAIARKLGRAPSGIHYELQHGFYLHLDGATWQRIKKYSADIAQKKAEYECTSKGKPIKLGNRYDYAATVAQRVKNGESPDAIVGSLRRLKQWTVSTPTLYRYINLNYIPDISDKDLFMKSHAKKKAHTPQRAKRAPKGVSIENRPPEIKDRVIPGHWEQDTVIGTSKGKAEALLVLVERKTRMGIVRKLPEKTQDAVTQQLQEIIPQYPAGTFLSLTVDNGAENQDYNGMKKLVGEVYYCHPYCSSERGSNENYNRLIRRQFPKGESMAHKTQEDAQRVQDYINNLPRKILGYASSKELFDEWQKKLIEHPPKVTE